MTKTLDELMALADFFACAPDPNTAAHDRDVLEEALRELIADATEAGWQAALDTFNQHGAAGWSIYREKALRNAVRKG